MESYQEMMKKAVRRTKEWGLECWSSVLVGNRLDTPLPVEAPISKNKAFWDFTEETSRSLPMPPEQRAKACAPVHLFAAALFMRGDLPFAPFVTIGDIHWDGDPCFHVNETTLKQALASGPDPTAEIRIHAWLTFPDMTVLDFTFPPWQCRQNGERMDLNEPGALRVFGDPEGLRKHYEYRPMLVGPEFLWRTASVSMLARQDFESAQRAWLQKLSIDG